MQQKYKSSVERLSKKLQRQPSKDELDLISFPKDKQKSAKFYKGTPNRDNHNTGYKGRTAIHEILEVDNPMKKLIFDGANQMK